MDNITPEDVAKGMFDYMTKQNDSIVISRENFRKIGVELLKEMTGELKELSDIMIGTLLITDRIRFMSRLEDKLFGEEETK